MPPTPSIFRAGALERYLQGRARLTLPEFIAPKAFALLWLVLGTVLACGALAWFAEVPHFESGVAVVVEGTRETGAAGGAVLLTFLPPDALPRLKPGQPLFLEPASRATQASSEVLAVEPRVLSPQEARARFGAQGVPSEVMAAPSAVLVARFEPSAAGRQASDYLGSTFPVSVRVGSQRLVQLLPFAGGARPEPR